MKIRFFEMINSSATSIIYRQLLYYSVCMRTSGEKVCLSGGAESVQSVHIRPVTSLGH